MKKNLLILVFVISSLASNAQTPSLTWATSFGGTGNDQGNSIAVDAQGNVYTVGWFVGTVDFDPSPNVFNLTATGLDDGFILKLDAVGNFIWAKRIGGSTTNIPLTIKQDRKNNFYISGYFDSTSDFNPDSSALFNLTSHGDFDAYILKTDQDGNMIWAKSLGGNGFDTPNSLALDSLGSAYVIGNFQGTVDFDPNAGISNLICVGFSDVFILKIDSLGNFEWVKQVAGLYPDNGLDIALDASNNVYATGIFHNIVDFDPGTGVYNLNSATGGTVFIEKLNSVGDFVWAQQVGDTLESQAWAITIDKQNNVYATGYFKNTGDFNPNVGIYNLASNGSFDVFILKLDSSGSFLWAKSFGGSDIDYASGIRTDALGNVYATGFFNNTVDFNPDTAIYNLSAPLYYDMYILKLNSVGDFQWAKNVDGNCAATTIAIDESDNLYFTGNFAGTADFDFNSPIYNLSSISGTDVFVAKYSPTSVGLIENNIDDSFTIYPNPTVGQFTILLNKPNQIERVEIYDLMGKLVDGKYNISNSTTFNLSVLPSDIYLIKLIDKVGGISTKKVIKF